MLIGCPRLRPGGSLVAPEGIQAAVSQFRSANTEAMYAATVPLGTSCIELDLRVGPGVVRRLLPNLFANQNRTVYVNLMWPVPAPGLWAGQEVELSVCDWAAPRLPDGEGYSLTRYSTGSG
jgi:hypothetical protein